VTGAIDKDIRKTQSNIDAKSKEYTKLTSSIGEAAREILAEQEKIKSLDAQIVALEQDVIRLGEEHKQKNAEVAVIEAQKKKLENERDDLEQKLVKILARDMAASKVLSEVDPSEEDDIVKAHLSKSISKTLAAYVEKLRSEYVARQKMIAELEQKIRQIKNSMAELENKKIRLAKAKEERISTIARTQKQIESYKARLERIAKEQQQARETLERLNILKRQKLAEAAKPKPKPQQPKAQKQLNEINIDDKELSDDIKMMGSSYQSTKGGRYTGRKVPGPLDSFRVVKQFGPYTDPIYKIKIHNDSVTLRSNNPDALVKNIMDGKVVFAKEVAALGNVVIVQHDGNLHSIYAHLNKIAPTVSAGKRIEQGAVVGRVERELTFEITKEDAPINPLDVITGG
jgi:murein DD-endopeptidase MepM/ murein hydrolase activator NlpD